MTLELVSNTKKKQLLKYWFLIDFVAVSRCFTWRRNNSARSNNGSPMDDKEFVTTRETCMLLGGTVTPGWSKPTDPHKYLSRPGSSQSLYGGMVGSRGT